LNADIGGIRDGYKKKKLGNDFSSYLVNGEPVHGEDEGCVD